MEMLTLKDTEGLDTHNDTGGELCLPSAFKSQLTTNDALIMYLCSET